jgi:hypothetical protein
MGVEAASAQEVYSLTVKVHRSITLTNAQVDRILAGASQLLKKKDGANDVACKVSFKRKGRVEPFASDDTPAVIKNRSDLDAVHKEQAQVKVVQEIDFCVGKHGSYEGCTWPHDVGINSMIVVHPGRARANLWAHEFGHRTGLRHRTEPGALMTMCNLSTGHVKVSKDECKCFHAGPGGCPEQDEPPQDTLQCPIMQNEDSSRFAANADEDRYLRRLSDWFRSP